MIGMENQTARGAATVAEPEHFAAVARRALPRLAQEMTMTQTSSANHPLPALKASQHEERHPECGTAGPGEVICERDAGHHGEHAAVTITTTHLEKW